MKIKILISSILFLILTISQPSSAARHHNNSITRIGYSLIDTLISVGRIDKLFKADELYGKDLLYSSGALYGDIAGILGDTTTDISTAILNLNIDDEEYTDSETVYHCTSHLPTAIGSGVFGPLTQMKHTWLRIGDQTYGMAMTLKKTYFGGPALILSPDMFSKKYNIMNVKGNCTPIKRPIEQSSAVFDRNLKCIADKLSNKNQKKLAVFDYHSLENNCLSAVRFIAECAEGKISQLPNMGIGGDVPWDKDGYSVHYELKLNDSYQSLSESTKKVLKTIYKKAYGYLWKFNSERNTGLKFFQLLKFREALKRAIRLEKKHDVISRTKYALKQTTAITKAIKIEEILAQPLKVEQFIIKRNLPKIVQINNLTTYYNLCQQARNQCNLN